jgi:hypothetical protein
MVKRIGQKKVGSIREIRTQRIKKYGIGAIGLITVRPSVNFGRQGGTWNGFSSNISV